MTNTSFDFSFTQVYFEGTAGGLDDSIALDDITMTPGCIKDPDQTLPVTVQPTGEMKMVKYNVEFWLLQKINL